MTFIEEVVRKRLRIGHDESLVEAVARVKENYHYLVSMGVIEERLPLHPKDDEVGRALRHIAEQADKRQFLNCISMTQKLMGILLIRFNDILKGRNDGNP